MNWLISANSNMYDHIAAFKSRETIDWKQKTTKFEVGDIVYIYASKPLQKITHRCVVEKINIEPEQAINDEPFWTNKESYHESISGTFARFRLLDELDIDSLSLLQLQQHGLNGNPQGRRKITSTLLAYIESQISAPSLINEIFNNDIQRASKLSQSERKILLAEYTKKPKRKQVTSYVYERNPYVVAECLIQAGGICQKCGKSAPFKRLSDSSPYLEVHHIIPLSHGGEDTLENVAAICPNCHRELHFGITKSPKEINMQQPNRNSDIHTPQTNHTKTSIIEEIHQALRIEHKFMGGWPNDYETSNPLLKHLEGNRHLNLCHELIEKLAKLLSEQSARNWTMIGTLYMASYNGDGDILLMLATLFVDYLESNEPFLIERYLEHGYEYSQLLFCFAHSPNKDDSYKEYLRFVPQEDRIALQYQEITWPSPCTPSGDLITIKSFPHSSSWLEIEKTVNKIFNTKRYFGYCKSCNSRNNQGHMHDDDTCQSCSGVTY